ncbi:MAG: endolytic transglycosylase MltG [Candidatus Peribacteraceae bacterium]|jgi:UPF0755 protein
MKLLRTIVIVLVVILLSTFVWYRHALTPVDVQDTVRVIVEIPQGLSVTSIAKLLHERGLIRSPRAFAWYVRLHGQTAAMRAGSIVLQKSLSAQEIVTNLSVGHGTEATVTIPEGYSVKDIDALLAAKGITQPGEIADCSRSCDFSSFEFLPDFKEGSTPAGGKLEGYLFPDTYFILKEEFIPKFFLERLLGTFRSRVVSGLTKDIAASGRSLSQIVTMASLVEKETRTDAERPVVAGILWKRLDAGMYLGVDAALLYGLDKANSLTKSDLESDSAYNLRSRKGLPPSAIGNPGLESIEAALHPKASPYMYYLHDKNGVIHYAVTNDEHNANRAKYLP